MATGPAFSRTLRYLSELAGAGDFATGVQLAVSVEGERVVDEAFGTTLGVPIERHHLHPAMCATKPIMGLACGLLMDRDGLTLDTVVRSPRHPGAREGVTVREILNHSAGLDQPTAMEWRMCPEADREALLRDANVSRAPAYSEVAGGLLLEDVVERRTGMTATAFIEQQMLAPLGLLDQIVVGGTRACSPSIRRRTAVPLANLPHHPMPMLSERIPRMLREIRPAFGGLTTATGLCRLYSSLGGVLRGQPVTGLPSPEATRALLHAGRGAVPDRLLGKSCDFAGGFMVRLADHGFGDRVSPDAFGHVGAMGHTVAFYDPDAQVAAAFYLNGCEVGLDAAAEAVRSIVVDGILEETGTLCAA